MSVSRSKLAALLVAAGCAAAVGLPAQIWSSDHQDTPEVELNPRCDINDVYAFPGSTSDRITLVLTTSSPIAAGQAAYFDPDKLYQIKIDNNVAANYGRDGIEDLVIQFTFEGAGAGQKIVMRGPFAPASTGTRNKLAQVAPTLTGGLDTALGSASDVQLWAGRRADPFFIDLEQFFKILPDRRPATGPLSTPANPPASSFRNPGVDLLGVYNCLAIVVEMPKAKLVGSGGGRLGIWATTSR